MGWHGHLDLHYRFEGARTVALDRHDGPLRVLQRLYPEGDRVCHHVLVHPPGGMVGGDTLDITARLEPGCHALVTTPAAARFYRSAGETAEQRVAIELDDGARLEWLPLETLAYNGCLAANRQRFLLRGQAQMFGWDLLALGLPAAGEPFERGRIEQHLELPGVWLERGLLDASDLTLLDSPLGLDGQRVVATLWFAAGRPIDNALREGLLASVREIAAAGPLAPRCGATAPQPEVVVLRALAPRVEPAFQLLRRVWAHWRQIAWQLEPCAPRVWST
jgi:urease accessory protein